MFPSSRSIVPLIGFLMLFSGLVIFSRTLPSPFPPLSESVSSSTSTLEDFIGVSLGFRRLSADIAWIQTLQYYGTHSEEGEDHVHESSTEASPAASYPLFLDFCQRVVHIDPYFTYAFYYGSSVLGWNLNRLDEAEAFLKQGILLNPKEWRLQQYLAALGFQKNHNMKDLTVFLEGMVQDPEAPNLLRSILANLYKKSNQFDKALQMWEYLYQSGDPSYRDLAIRKVIELKGLRAQPIGQAGLDKRPHP